LESLNIKTYQQIIPSDTKFTHEMWNIKKNYLQEKLMLVECPIENMIECIVTDMGFALEF